MAAYGALASLMHIIDQLQHHPSPISLGIKQVESLTQNVTFLQEFLQGYNSPVVDNDEADPLQRRRWSMISGREISLHLLVLQDLLPQGRTVSWWTDDVVLEIIPDRQVIPIVGMGSIGKTTLARNIYSQSLIKEHFDVCAWATISQQYDAREIICQVLPQANKESKEGPSKMSEDEVGLALHKYLSGRRSLIVMDDMWSIEAWDKIQPSMPCKLQSMSHARSIICDDDDKVLTCPSSGLSVFPRLEQS